MDNEDIRRRYETDHTFRACVANMQAMLHAGYLTPHDLARAAVLAATIYAERHHAPAQIVLLEGSDQSGMCSVCGYPEGSGICERRHS